MQTQELENFMFEFTYILSIILFYFIYIYSVSAIKIMLKVKLCLNIYFIREVLYIWILQSNTSLAMSQRKEGFFSIDNNVPK